MSSPCPRLDRARWLATCAAAAVALCGCQREDREYRGTPAPETAPAPPRQSALSPGGPPSPPPTDPRGRHYESNAYDINQGQRLYRWFNCNGCHAAGGGDAGPALMDAEWRYGGDIEHIYDSIAHGRPNGMPAFGDKIPSQQIWQLSAYVRSLGGNVPRDAAPSRDEGLSTTPPQTQLPPQKTSGAEPTHQQEPSR